MKIYVDKISPNPEQPRRSFDAKEIEELANSIKAQDLLMPILVEDLGNGQYQLVHGERRLRACKLLKLKEIEAIVRPLSNHNGLDRLIDATTENVARKNMNAVDEALAYQRMVEKGLNITEIARRVGTSIPNIYSKMKILKFSEAEQALMAAKKLPVVDDALDALLSIPSEKERIEMSMRLAEKGANGALVIRACEKFLNMKRAVRKQKKLNKGVTPAISMVSQKELPEWDALYQVGKVPPWKVFTESVMSTCDCCSLRANASDATCGFCPLVVMVKNTLEQVKHG